MSLTTDTTYKITLMASSLNYQEITINGSVEAKIMALTIADQLRFFFEKEIPQEGMQVILTKEYYTQDDDGNILESKIEELEY